MIFMECDNGLKIEITHSEMMRDDTIGFMFCILKARAIYQRNHHADVDDDDTDKE